MEKLNYVWFPLYGEAGIYIILEKHPLIINYVSIEGFNFIIISKTMSSIKNGEIFHRTGR